MADPDIIVTKINNRWHARMIVDDIVQDEMACENRADIGWICREMLRWFDKGGGCSNFASAARHRQKTGAQGKVWYRGELENSKAKRKASSEDY